MEKENNAPQGAICVDVNNLIETCKTGGIPKHTIMELISEITRAQGFSVRETKALISRIEADSVESFLSSEGYSDEFKWSAQMSIDGLVHMFEKHCTVKEAFEHVRNKYNKTDDWLRKSKHKKMHPSTQRSIVERVQEQVGKEVDKMKALNTWDEDLMIKTSSATQQFKKAHHLITLTDRVDMIENKLEVTQKLLEDQSQELQEMKLRLLYAEHNITALGNKIDVPVGNVQEDIKRLHQENISVPQIAKMLSLPVRKVKYLLYGK